MPGAGPAGAVMRLHDYWRSSAGYRVRIALNLKGVGFERVTHDLRTSAQRAAPYLDLAPQGLIPAIEADGEVLTQSSAILEWIEERWPTPPLLPSDPTERAIVRAMVALIACDIHPLNNLRVLKRLRGDFAADEAQVQAWIAHWVTLGFGALEQQVTRYGRGFAFGGRPTLADCALVPQIFSAERFGIDLACFPHLTEAAQRARALDAVAAAHPAVQSDAD